MAQTWKVLVICSALAGIQCAHGPPRIIPDREEMEILAGQDINLICLSDSTSEWDYPALKSTSRKATISEDSWHESKFSLKKSEYNDTGYYYCRKKLRRTLEGDMKEKDSIYVYVKDFSNPIIVDQAFPRFINGDPATIQCRPTSPVFQIKLLKEFEDQIVTKDGKNNTWKFDPKRGFTIEHFHKKNDGQYYCEYGNATKMIFPTVLKNNSVVPKPKIIHGSQRHIEGKDVNLTCVVNVEYDVQVNFTWKTPPQAKDFKIGKIYTEKNKSGLQMSTNLTLSAIKKQGSGTYTCIVTNHLGNTNNASTIINVLDPNISFINFNLQDAAADCTIVTEGENVTWIVDIDAVPPVTIGWHFSNGTSIPRNIKRYVISTDKNIETKFHILGVLRTDSGIFVLKAKSTKLARDFNICLLVKCKPEVRLQSPSIKYEPGKIYRINCTAKGYPTPIIKWSFKACQNGNVDKCFQPKEIPSSHYTQSRVDNVTTSSTLTIKAEESGFVMCQASNEQGNSRLRDHSFTVTGSESGPNSGMIVGIIIVVIIFLVLIGFLSYRIKKEKGRRKELEKGGIFHFEEGDIGLISKDLPIDEQADLLPYNKQWEFPKEKLKLGKQLGAGAFGMVLKAEAEGIIEGEAVTTVAVKMVKRDAEFVFLKALASELKIMVHLGKHLNVVNLLGACTNNITKRELYVIVEYCPFGNLHNYLLRHREDFINQINKETGKIDPTIGQDILAQAEYSIRKLKPKVSLVSFSNSGNDSSASYHSSADNSETICMLPTGETSSGSGSTSSNTVMPEWRSNYKSDYKGKVRPITTQDLVCWSFQVSRGMEYLVNRKVMHGDLAARNILLAQNNIVKICDFGLAKSIYKSENYKKKGDGPLPIKWMALESIQDRIFSTQSDVWSFGIVLWEFFSLATTPYPGMQPNEEFYNKLVSGYRMEKPTYATEEIYQMMSACWLKNPNERPSFTELAEKMGFLLDSTIRNHYINLNDPYMKMNQEWQQNRSDYLNMLNVPTYNNLVSPCKDESHVYVNSPVTPDGNDFNTTDMGSGYLNMSGPASPFATSPGCGSHSPQWLELTDKRRSMRTSDLGSVDLMQHL